MPRVFLWSFLGQAANIFLKNKEPRRREFHPRIFWAARRVFSREWYLPSDGWKVYADITFCCPPLTCPKGKPYQWSLNQMDEWSKGHINHINISLTKRNWVATNHSPQGGWSIHITPDTIIIYCHSRLQTTEATKPDTNPPVTHGKDVNLRQLGSWKCHGTFCLEDE